MLKRAPHCRRATGFIYVLCLSSLALAGCVASPPAPSAAVPVVAVPTVWAAPVAAAASAATVAAPVDLTSWWRSFKDPELDALVARSLGAAPDLEACAARVRAVRAMAQASNASLGPQLSLVGMPQQSPDGRDNYFQSGIAAQWNVPLSQRQSALKGLADAELQIALADEQAARATLVADVARTYFEMRAAERDQQQDRRGHEQLVGDRVENAAELRLLRPGAREIAVEPIGRGRHAVNGARHVTPFVAVHPEQRDDDRNCDDAAQGQPHRQRKRHTRDRLEVCGGLPWCDFTRRRGSGHRFFWRPPCPPRPPPRDRRARPV